jgi:hypothetical protein
MEYLLWNNLERPHKGIGQIAPVNYILLNFESSIKKGL